MSRITRQALLLPLLATGTLVSAMDKPLGAGAAAITATDLTAAIPAEVRHLFAAAGDDKPLNLRGRTITRVEVNGQEAVFGEHQTGGAAVGYRVRIPQAVRPGMGSIVTIYDDGSRDVQTLSFLPSEGGEAWAEAFLQGLDSFPRVAAGASFQADRQEELVRVSINGVETSFARVGNGAAIVEYSISIPAEVRLGLGEVCLEHKDGRRVWTQLVFCKADGMEAPKAGGERKS